jgi:hypothetical protein
MDGLFHENHEEAYSLLKQSLGDDYNTLLKAHEDYFNNPSTPTRHLIAKHYVRKYFSDANLHDSLAVGLHHDKEYTNAAGNLDAGNEDIAKIAQVLSYNFGADHPLAKQTAEYHNSRYDATSQYKQMLGLNKEDTNRRFDDLMRGARHDPDPWANFGGN